MTQHLISAAELAGRLDEKDICIFDVRHNLTDHGAGRREYDAGHIPGAQFLDHETELSGVKTGKNGRHPLPDIDVFAALMTERGVRPGVPVVAYDASGGMFAAHLWWMLRWLGHTSVQVLDGGWQAWQAGGYAVSKAPGAPALAGAQTGSAPVWPVSAAGLVTAADVMANIPKQAFTVIDARAANRYRGEVEPMDPFAGHIPGAINRPNTENLQPDGRFKSAEVLAREFDALLRDRAPADVVHQCGSGITACHNLLAMEIAGKSGSRLYAGSWSEWCADPLRPIAMG